METKEKIKQLKAAFQQTSFTQKQKKALWLLVALTLSEEEAKIPVNFNVIYRTKDATDEQPYIDLQRITEIWGVAINGIRIKNMELSLTRGQVREHEKIFRARLLTLDELKEVYQNKKVINAAFEELSVFGVQVDLIGRAHWRYMSSTKTCIGDYAAFDMNSGALTAVSGRYSEAVRFTLP